MVTPTLPTAATYGITDVNDIDAWFPRADAVAPELPATLEAAHDNLARDYAQRQDAEEAKRARYVNRWRRNA